MVRSTGLTGWRRRDSTQTFAVNASRRIDSEHLSGVATHASHGATLYALRNRPTVPSGDPRWASCSVSMVSCDVLESAPCDAAFSEAGASLLASRPAPPQRVPAELHSGCGRSGRFAANAPAVGRGDSSPASVKSCHPRHTNKGEHHEHQGAHRLRHPHQRKRQELLEPSGVAFGNRDGSFTLKLDILPQTKLSSCARRSLSPRRRRPSSGRPEGKFEDSESPGPGDEPVRELWSFVLLDEVAPADSVVRLTSSARNVVNQDPVQLAENRVVAPEDAQERLFESTETFPGTAVAWDGGVTQARRELALGTRARQPYSCGSGRVHRRPRFPCR